MKNKFDLVVLIHRLYYGGEPKKGGLDLVLDQIVARGFRVLIVEYPIDYQIYQVVKVSTLDSNGKECLLSIKMPIKNNFLDWFLELLFSVYFSIKFKLFGCAVISSDPLSTLPALFLRKIGFFSFHYYHSVDYSLTRFANPTLNSFYKFLFELGARNADLVGVVTPKAEERIKSIKVHNIICIPNSPDFDYCTRFRKDIRQRASNTMVVTCSEVSYKYKIYELVELLSVLKRDFKNSTLKVVGYFDPSDSYCQSLLQLVEGKNLGDSVVFCGHVDRDLNMDIIGSAYIGLAFYDNSFSHIGYGDSLKIREYAALGLPTVSDKTTPTSDELEKEKAGFTVDSFGEAYEKISLLISDPKLYADCSRNALGWAKKVDKRVVVKNLLKTLRLNKPNDKQNY